MLFTITTCLHLPRKAEQTMKCLDSLFSVETYWEPVTEFVMINEYAEGGAEGGTEGGAEGGAEKMIKERYPFFKFIQKDKQLKGQARSINIIIDLLKSDTVHEYWLHWEESWMLSEPFMRDALGIMKNESCVTQLQIAKGWDDVPHDVKDGYLLVSKDYHNKIDKQLGSVVRCKWKRKPWPLFSLQPGIDRVDEIIGAGYFYPEHNSVPDGKVNGSEFHFSHRWYLQGVRKAVLLPFRAFRDPAHVSTSRFIS